MEGPELSLEGIKASMVWSAERAERTRMPPTKIAFVDDLTLEPNAPPGLSPGMVIETYGYTGSAKTELALNIVASWVLSSEYGGLGSTAVYVDLDMRLNVARLYHLLRTKATECGAQPSEQRASAEEALNRVVLAKCFDELELLSTLEVLKGDLSAARPVLLVLDSIGSLYYSKKMAECCGQGSASLQHAVIRAVEALVQRKSAAVLACKPCLFASKITQLEGGPTIEHKEYMPKSWERLVTHRIVLVKEDLGGVGRVGLSAPPVSTFTARVTYTSRSAGQHGSSTTALARFVVDSGGVYAIGDGNGMEETE